MGIDALRSVRDYEYRGISRIGDTYSACALAKLNISLSIGGKGNDGMHEMSGIFQTVSLHDTVTLRRTGKGNSGMAGSIVEDNIAWKALEELERETGRSLSCRITIAKSIPMAAGMGGGSSDAAAVLRLANRAFSLGMTVRELQRVAERVGNDVSFLLYGGRAMVSGAASHRIARMRSPALHYLVAHPDMELSTREMYALHDRTGKDFTRLASELCADTGRLLGEMRPGSVECGVTGKGPTVFAGYRTFAECTAASPRISWFKGDTFIERAIDSYV